MTAKTFILAAEVYLYNFPNTKLYFSLIMEENKLHLHTIP